MNLVKNVALSVVIATTVMGNAFAWAHRPHNHNYTPETSRVNDVANGPTVGVPEPGTLGLMGVGLLAVGFIARRRK